MKLFAFALAFLALASPAAASWQPADSVSAPNSSNLLAGVAMNARGDSPVTWVRKAPPNRVQVASRSAAGDWTQPTTLPIKNPFAAPRVALDGRGHANVVWETAVGSKRLIWTAVSSVSGTSSPVDLTDGGSGVEPAIAVNERGDAVAAWGGFDGISLVAQAAVRPAGGLWGKPETISHNI